MDLHAPGSGHIYVECPTALFPEIKRPDVIYLGRFCAFKVTISQEWNGIPLLVFEFSQRHQQREVLQDITVPTVVQNVDLIRSEFIPEGLECLEVVIGEIPCAGSTRAEQFVYIILPGSGDHLADAFGPVHPESEVMHQHVFVAAIHPAKRLDHAEQDLLQGNAGKNIITGIEHPVGRSCRNDPVHTLRVRIIPLPEQGIQVHVILDEGFTLTVYGW